MEAGASQRRLDLACVRATALRRHRCGRGRHGREGEREKAAEGRRSRGRLREVKASTKQRPQQQVGLAQPRCRGSLEPLAARVCGSCIVARDRCGAALPARSAGRAGGRAGSVGRYEVGAQRVAPSAGPEARPVPSPWQDPPGRHQRLRACAGRVSVLTPTACAGRLPGSPSICWGLGCGLEQPAGVSSSQLGMSRRRRSPTVRAGSV